MTGSPVAGLLACGLAAAAGAVGSGTRPSGLARLASPAPLAHRPAGRPPRSWWAPAPVAGAVAGVASRSVLLGLAAAVVGLAVCRAAAARRARRRTAAHRAAASELVGALSAELRAGAAPREALAVVAAAFPEVAAAARSPAADPAAALRRAADGEPLLADVAVAWQVTEATGAALAGPAEHLAAAARSAETLRRELDGQLAGPRATAALLAVLPLAGVLLGSALGADPAAFLLATPAGRGCLLGGAVLVAVGVGWTEALVARVAGP